MPKKEFWLNGSQYAVVYEDGDIYIDGKSRGRLYKDGSLYIDGEQRGKLYNDGDLYLDGKKIGKFYSDGEFWSDGGKQGKVYEDKTVTKENSDIIGNDISERKLNQNDTSTIDIAPGGAGIGPLLLGIIVIAMLIMLSFYASYKTWVTMFTDQLLQYSDQPINMVITGCVIVIVQALAFFLQVNKMIKDRSSNGFFCGMLYHMIAVFIHMTFATILLDGVSTTISGITLSEIISDIIFPMLLVCFVLALVPATVGWLIGKLLRLIKNRNKKSEDDAKEQRYKIPRRRMIGIVGIIGILIFVILYFFNADKTGEEIASIDTEELVSKFESTEDTSQKRAEDYVRKYDDQEYIDLLQTMEICFWDSDFESTEEIDDLGLYFSWFVSLEYSYEEIENWYNPSLQVYEVPGQIIRDTMCKYFAFDELDLTEYFPQQKNSDSGNEWYDVEKDLYYGWLGGFGGPHDGYSELEIEVIEYGVVKATGKWGMEDRSEVTATIIVEETEEALRLRSYIHNVGEAKAYSHEELVNMAIEYRKRHNLYECMYVEVDHENGDMVVIHCYDIIIYPEEGGHTATSDWYEVNRYTAVGTNILEEYIDLKN